MPSLWKRFAQYSHPLRPGSSMSKASTTLLTYLLILLYCASDKVLVKEQIEFFLILAIDSKSNMPSVMITDLLSHM